MASGPSEKGRTIRLSTELFLHIELVVYVALGILLSLTALLSLGSAALLLLEGMRDWSGTRAILDHRAHRFDPKRSRHHSEVIGNDLGGPRGS